MLTRQISQLEKPLQFFLRGRNCSSTRLDRGDSLRQSRDLRKRRLQIRLACKLGVEPRQNVACFIQLVCRDVFAGSGQIGFGIGSPRLHPLLMRRSSQLFHETLLPRDRRPKIDQCRFRLRQSIRLK